MSANRDKLKIKIEGGQQCTQCGQPMQRYKHSENWRPLPGRNYFAFWDVCSCRRIQHYEAAKVFAA